MRNNAVLANPGSGASAKVYSFSKPKQETNKKKGQKSEVYPYQLDDLKRILNYFAERNAWFRPHPGSIQDDERKMGGFF